jgi:NADH-quinone oxidoreductase subunit F
MRELIYDIGGGVPNERALKAVIPGGSSTSVLTADELDVKMDFTSLVEAGSSIGSAGVIVIDERCCMVQLGIRVSQFYEHESCGKCTPCRVGTRWITQILQKIEAGRAGQADLDLLLSVCDRVLGKCLCPLGDSDAIAVLSYVDRFRDEYQAHIDLGRCPYDGESSLERILAPAAMHEHHGREPVTA